MSGGSGSAGEEGSASVAAGGPEGREGGGGGPGRSLSALDGVVLIVGVVLGVGIFRSPQVVAANTNHGAVFLALWLAGGAISLLGALCYAELGAAYPDTGGEYHFITRAFGRPLGFLFVWARMTVIQTGSIAILGFVFGDYAARLLSLGDWAPPVLAAASVVGLTGLNVAGLRPGRWGQWVLTGGSVLGLVSVVTAGLFVDAGASAAASGPGPAAAETAFRPGLALIFVLLAYGGWSEGAYLSAEIRDRRGTGRALLWGTAAIAVLYLLANAAYLEGLGLAGIAATDAVAVELLRVSAGPWGARAVGAVIVLAALSSANATIITGARSNYAMGRDHSLFRGMAAWHSGREAPTTALLVQGAISLALVGFGSLTRSGFEATVSYTAPVFWLVLLLSGAAVIVLRRREPDARRPFRVPLYPLTPLLFCAAAAYMVFSSVRDAGDGALLGLAVMALGVPLYWISSRKTGSGGGTRSRRASDVSEVDDA